ncbi:MAG TPA: type II toxin-antitoxin system HicA family toxin [Candidatus Kapabacteria bacterium]|jgi:predicted RNA binding protein YcfA (HicA-like mRNA interferase family)
MRTPRGLSGSELMKALGSFGYSPVRQTGSHVQLMTKENGEHHLSIPLHSPLRIGTLNAILNLVADHFKISKSDVLDRLLK